MSPFVKIEEAFKSNDFDCEVSYDEIKDECIKFYTKEFINIYLRVNLNRFLKRRYPRMDKDGVSSIQKYVGVLLSKIPDTDKQPVIIKLLEADSQSRIINYELSFP